MPSLRRNYWNSILLGKSNKIILLGFDLGQRDPKYQRVSLTSVGRN
jgi:hypothetical protein